MISGIFCKGFSLKKSSNKKPSKNKYNNDRKLSMKLKFMLFKRKKKDLERNEKKQNETIRLVFSIWLISSSYKKKKKFNRLIRNDDERLKKNEKKT